VHLCAFFHWLKDSGWFDVLVFLDGGAHFGLSVEGVVVLDAYGGLFEAVVCCVVRPAVLALERLVQHFFRGRHGLLGLAVPQADGGRLELLYVVRVRLLGRELDEVARLLRLVVVREALVCRDRGGDLALDQHRLVDHVHLLEVLPVGRLEQVRVVAQREGRRKRRSLLLLLLRDVSGNEMRLRGRLEIALVVAEPDGSSLHV